MKVWLIVIAVVVSCVMCCGCTNASDSDQDSGNIVIISRDSIGDYNNHKIVTVISFKDDPSRRCVLASIYGEGVAVDCFEV